MLSDKDLFLNGDPLQQLAEPLDVGIARHDLLDAGNGFQLRAATLLERDGSALVRNDCLGAIDHCLQDPIEI